MRSVREKSFYVFQDNTLVGDMKVVEEPRDVLPTSLWHKRLGYMSERCLKELSKIDYFGKEKLDDLEFCENCIYGKATRVKFIRSIEVTRKMISYVYSDLWGHNDKALSKFKDWKKMVETRTGKKVKKLRTDNSLEYLGEEFN
ncbi:uncharacterized mitochondrial protein AtMg00300-like [Impatiens glandulifera]|uniref:uncharacterized mitochondrial protein AtMg00300-like n=1 Tax=Impatiens glandulifera TaxID=253017 RepID=UPI001FB06B3F|nr:uncharacterized mitochondrial protein AtMg00300-like [Impatiens glandulifera]